ncbi:hypothetical protein SADUNF_Sadunf13G0102200 [Salix dunnii]|uniref:Uncharacterized protein n=1 Tax=Salix dunnii TaxID=1413687 RepID=A0A835MNP4_9ROSI|nr:hypothetical protein SADUNF_Sadunf13G0102200 [Salix dunnii]
MPGECAQMLKVWVKKGNGIYLLDRHGPSKTHVLVRESDQVLLHERARNREGKTRNGDSKVFTRKNTHESASTKSPATCLGQSQAKSSTLLSK